jgi:hypothetical protein
VFTTEYTFTIGQSKYQFHPRADNVDPEEKQKNNFTLFLRIRLEVGEWSSPRPDCFAPEKTLCIYLQEIMVGGSGVA